MDKYFEGLGYKRISIDKCTSLDQNIHKGIDGVYYKKGGNPEYIIGEAKYGRARLGNTRDGKQMSDGWIDGSNRLENAVGESKAAEIRETDYGRYLYRIKSDGTEIVKKLED